MLVKPKQIYLAEKQPVIGYTASNQAVRLIDNIVNKHWQICGSTGTGKSAFLYQLCLFLLHSNNGGIIIDPHGSLKEQIEIYVSTFASFLVDKLIFVDNFAETLDYIVGLNPVRPDLKNDEMQYSTLLLVESILKAFGNREPSETPRISRQLYNTLLPIISNKTSLIDAQYFLDPAKENERNYLLQNTQDEMVKADWALINKLPPAKQLEQLEGLANRLRPLLSNDRLRMILSAKSLNISKLMEERKVVILNMNPNNKAISAEARLLGIMLINSIYMVAKNRNWRDKNLSNFFVIIDEFAQYVSHEIAYSLEQLRKFRCYFILSYQHLAQLAIDNPYLAASVMGNCHSRLCFSVSYDDAEILSRQILLPDIDLLEVKYIDTSERYRPTLQLLNVITKSRSTTSSESFSNGQSSSFSTSQSSSQGTNDSTSKREQEQWIEDSRDNYITRSNALISNNSFGTGETKGTNTSTTKGISTTRGESISKSPVTIHERYFEEKFTYFTLSEQVHRCTSSIVNQQVGEAYLKVLGNRAVSLKLVYIPPIPFDELKTPVLLDYLKDNLLYFHDCYSQVCTSTKATTVVLPQSSETAGLFTASNAPAIEPPQPEKKRKKKSIFAPTIEED